MRLMLTLSGLLLTQTILERFLQNEGQVWWRSGQPVNEVISEIAMVSAEIAEDIRNLIDYRTYDQEALEKGDENPFEKDAHYEEEIPDGSDILIEWAGFEHSIKVKSRFFSRYAQEILDKIFTNANELSSVSKIPIVVDVGPEEKIKSIYRARVFQSENELTKTMERPDFFLGPPQAEWAVAGRMNPQGIAVFYGATTDELAIAEVRPPVSSRVVTGEFVLLRPLKLLNVDALSKLFISGSFFDPKHIKRLKYAQFLKKLREKYHALYSQTMKRKNIL